MLYLVLAAVLGPLLVGGIEELRMNWAVNAAMKDTRVQEQKICDGRVAAIATATTTDALDKVDISAAAGRAMTPTPDAREAVKALCAKEAACRKQ